MGSFAKWRRRGDSNPRTERAGQQISSLPHSTTLPPLRIHFCRADNGSVFRPRSKARFLKRKPYPFYIKDSRCQSETCAKVKKPRKIRSAGSENFFALFNFRFVAEML